MLYTYVRQPRTGVFNLADLVLMVGAGLWLLVVIREMQAPSGSTGSA